MQRTKAVASAATAAARQLMNSGSKAMRRNKKQDSDVAVQQGDASAVANKPSANASDNSNSGANATQEHGVADPNASFLSDLEARTPRSATNTTN